MPDRIEEARRALDEILRTAEFRDHSRWRDAIDTELPTALALTESHFDYADAAWARHRAAVRRWWKHLLTWTTPLLVLEMSLVAALLTLHRQWVASTPQGWSALLSWLLWSALLIAAGIGVGLVARLMRQDVRVMRSAAAEQDARYRRYLRIAVAETASRVINRRAEHLAFPVDAPRTDLLIEPLVGVSSFTWLDLDASVELVDRRVVGAPRVLSVLCHAVTGGRTDNLLDAARRCIQAPGEEPVDRLRDAVAVHVRWSWVAKAVSMYDVDDSAVDVVLPDDLAMNLVYDATLALREGTIPLQEVLDTLADPAATTPVVRALVLATELGVTTLALARSVSWSPSPADQERLEADAAVLASAVRAVDELAEGLAEPHADVLAAARGVARRCGLRL